MELSINEVEGGGGGLPLPSAQSFMRTAPLAGLLLFAFFSADFQFFDKTSKRARGMNGHLEGFKHIITSVIVHE